MKYLILLPLLLIFSTTFSQEKNIKKEKLYMSDAKNKQRSVRNFLCAFNK